VIASRGVSHLSGLPRSRLTPRLGWSLLRETCGEWYDDRAPRLGAALAFYTVFALAPGLILIIALVALLLGQEAAQGQIISQVEDLAGVAGAQAVQAAIESAGNARSSLLATSLGTPIFSPPTRARFPRSRPT
jgi:membrane protein